MSMNSREGLEERMRTAVAIAKVGIGKGQSPFGASIYDARGEPIVAEHNRVQSALDPSAHAEVEAIRSACKKIGQPDLSGFWLFATCEPCAMCASAIVLAGIRNVVFGATVQDAQEAGFTLLQFECRETFDRVDPEFLVYGEILRQECQNLFQRAGD
ncbi:nucleoside deaminase [Roseiconus nitratireducens]|uniref:Nucleoside deaminase n=1 Tax=Roseiconus nitratireducens TaxID=2605748 RepID=A0A5M6DGP3_9BACT|nr:nucleoside deaminase [Roseiconus nitratireducens]KAA5545450.1 nucleoside deaminase [Roseiconus nitratireducens]